MTSPIIVSLDYSLPFEIMGDISGLDISVLLGKRT